MTEKKIKNTEDRFRKEVKEYWEKHQIQKDSYYDIVISYIKDYVENVYNKKKDKKKPKLLTHFYDLHDLHVADN